jgi:2-hydroxychromene-2-carboxylate isomerase
MAEQVPPGFPPMTLTIMRALCALTVLYPGAKGQEALIKCLDKLYHACWVEHQMTQDKEVLSGVLSSIIGAEDAAKGERLLFPQKYMR